MASIDFQVSGDFKNIERFLKKALGNDLYSKLDSYGRRGVEALRAATPTESGETAAGWGYRVIKSKTNPGIEWYNDHVVDGANIAILIQYGHGTRNGGYVKGRDYINPAIQPIFDEIVDAMWKEVLS